MRSLGYESGIFFFVMRFIMFYKRVITIITTTNKKQ